VSQAHFVPISSGNDKEWEYSITLVHRKGMHFSILSFKNIPAEMKIKFGITLNHRITESQNGRGWKGPLGVI